MYIPHWQNGLAQYAGPPALCNLYTGSSSVGMGEKMRKLRTQGLKVVLP